MINTMELEFLQLVSYTVVGLFGLLVIMGLIIGAKDLYVSYQSMKIKIEPFNFGDTLFFLDNGEYNTFKPVKGKVVKIRKEISNTKNGTEAIEYSYKLKTNSEKTDFINQKFLSNDVDDILSRLNILGDVKKKYAKL